MSPLTRWFAALSRVPLFVVYFDHCQRRRRSRMGVDRRKNKYLSDMHKQWRQGYT
jgi:hypothetical protein